MKPKKELTYDELMGKIERAVKLYRLKFNIPSIKIVMKTKIFEKIVNESPIQTPPESINEHMLFGCPVEVYDGIIVDWYVTENLLDDGGDEYAYTF